MMHWDDVSYVHRHILALAGPLTRFLNNDFDASSVEKFILPIWREAFELDWDGDLDILPSTFSPLLPKSFNYIKTRKMYQRYQICADYNPVSHWVFEKYWNHYNDADNSAPSIKIKHIMAAPMNNMWLDEIDYFLQYPIALAKAAIVGGHVQLLDYLATEKGVDVSRITTVNHNFLAIDAAVMHGNLNMIKYLRAKGNQTAPCREAMKSVATRGYLEVAKWLHENGYAIATPSNTRILIKHGHVEILKCFVENGVVNSQDDEMTKCLDLDGAVNLEMIKYLHENCNATCTTKIMDEAADDGHLDVVKYLDKHRTEGCTTHAMDNAASRGHINVVRYLHENRTEGCTTHAMDGAAARGYLDIVQYLHENRYEGCTTNAMDFAARNGHLDVVKFLHENRTEGCTTNAMDFAAKNGHLNVVKFLHEKRTEGCTGGAMNQAAYHGYLSIVKYLHKNRTEGLVVSAIQYAMARHHWDVVRYLKEYVVSRTTTKQGFG